MDIVRAAEQAGEYVSDYVHSHVGCLGLENNPQVGYEIFRPFTTFLGIHPTVLTVG